MNSRLRTCTGGFTTSTDSLDNELQDNGFACSGRTRARRDGLGDLLAPTALPQNRHQQPARKVAVSDLWFGLSDEIVDSILLKSPVSPSNVSDLSNLRNSANRRRKVGMGDLFHYPGADIRHLDARAVNAVDKHDGA